MRYSDTARHALGGAAAAMLLGLVSTQPSLAQRTDLGDGPISCTDFRRGPNLHFSS